MMFCPGATFFPVSSAVSAGSFTVPERKLPRQRAFVCYVVVVSFATGFRSLPVEDLVKRSLRASSASARASISRSRLSLEDFGNLISPAAGQFLEPLSRRSREVTQQR